MCGRPYSLYMQRENILALVTAALLVGCAVEAPQPPPATDYGFADDVAAAAPAYGMTDEWVTWMVAHAERYRAAYFLGQAGKTDWRINVTFEAPIAYFPAWGSDEEHAAAIQKLLELGFPGWTFTVGFGLANADRTVHLGHKGISYAEGNDVWLVWEGIIIHEMGHTFGLPHEYHSGPHGEVLVDADDHPPGERPCVMSRNAVTWGQTETYILHLGAPSDPTEVSAAVTALNIRYPF